METKIKLYQPLFYSTLKEKIMNSTSISKPARMDICEFSLNVKDPHSLSIIPSPFCEWIIGYNKNNMKSSFYCLGSVSELTTIELKHYDYYIDIRFDDNVCYVQVSNGEESTDKESEHKTGESNSKDIGNEEKQHE